MFDPSSKNGTLCKAIAFAEGCINIDDTAYNRHALPFRLNNPGDLKATSSKFPHTVDSNSGKLAFHNLGDGWNALAHQVDLMLSGKSEVYKPEMTLDEVAGHYVGTTEAEAKDWAQNVAAFLHLPRLSPVNDESPEKAPFNTSLTLNELTEKYLEQKPKEEGVIEESVNTEQPEQSQPNKLGVNTTSGSGNIPMPDKASKSSVVTQETLIDQKPQSTVVDKPDSPNPKSNIGSLPVIPRKEEK